MLSTLGHQMFNVRFNLILDEAYRPSSKSYTLGEVLIIVLATSI